MQAIVGGLGFEWCVTKPVLMSLSFSSASQTANLVSVSIDACFGLKP